MKTTEFEVQFGKILLMEEVKMIFRSLMDNFKEEVST